jgi:hypothetical protein
MTMLVNLAQDELRSLHETGDSNAKAREGR